ncbi:MAG: hypothetical protein MJZ58_01135 [Paludibacteraceae bacterium]|nr:hypothetical protein [Paludibacteraceae bacterium]
MIDTTSTNVRTALVDTAKNLRDAINDINTNLCTTIMSCTGIQTMRDSIQTNKNAIVANATAISTETTNRTTADNEIKGIINADSIAIMKNVSDTATAVRKLITGAGGDISALTQRLIADSTILANRIHNDSTTLTSKMRADSTTLANRIHTDSIALVDRIVSDSAFLHYHIDTTASNIRSEIGSLSDDLVNRLVNDSTTLTTKMRADSTTLASRIHTDSIALVNRIVSDSTALKGMIDTTSTNVRSALVDTAKNLRDAIDDINTNLCTTVMACNGIKTMRDSIQTNKNAIVTNASNIAANAAAISDEINNRTTADNEIKGIIKADSTDIMKNVSDTASAIRALITGAHGDVGKLDEKVDSLNNNLFDTLHIKYVTNTVLADTIKDVRDSISALRDSMTTNYVSNADLCDKVMDCADIKTMRDSIQTNAANIKADSIFFAGRVKDLSDSVKMNVTAIIDSSKNIRDEIADTASTLRGLISDAEGDITALTQRLVNDSTILANRIHTDSTTLTTKMRADSTTLASRINADSIALVDRIVSDSTALKGMIDTTSANVRSALVDTAKNLRDAIDDINTNLCTTVMACNGIKTMRDSIQTNKNAIVTNASNIAANAAAISDEINNRTTADNEIKGIIKADSTDIMKNVSDTASAIRALITGAHGDVGKLDEKVDSLNNNLFDTLHIKYVTNTVLADTIKDVRDSISALRDSISKNYVKDSELCTKVMDCDKIKAMRDSIQKNASNIYADSVLFAGRVKDLSDSVKMNVKAIQDSSKHIREEIGSMNDDLIARLKADSLFQLKQDTILARSIKDTVAKHLANNSSAINNAVDTIAQNWIKAAAADSLISARELGDSLKNFREGTIANVLDSISALKDSVEHNYVSNSDLCTKVTTCVNSQISNLRDSVNTLYVHTTKAALRDSVAGQIHDSLSTFSSTLHTHANKTLLDTYTQTEADLADAVVKKHEHSNKDILDATTASYTTAEQTKLTGIAEGAEVNVNADWTATSGDAQILNKPTTISGYGITDAKIDMTKKQVIMGTDTLDVSDAAKDGKLTLKVNGDSIGSFSANQATNTEINIKCRQTSVRLKLTEETVDTLSVGMVLAIPTNFNAVDSVDHLIQLYINGVYVGDTVDGVLVYSNGKLTYDATKNDNKILVADERIQVVYWVK